MQTLKCGNYSLEIGKRTYIMGILNVTPDSFADDGIFNNLEMAVEKAVRMVDEGADIIDVGGESTRPGSESISVKEELNRISPVVKILRDKLKVPISVDTYKPEVATEVLDMGVDILNDITGLRNAEMIKTIAKYDASAVVMHMKGEPKTMQENPTYENVVKEIKEFFVSRIDDALDNGMGKYKIIIDPGIGFGKNVEHNLDVIRNLNDFKSLGFPLMVGTSRKSFIGKILDLPVEERLEGSIAALVSSVINGADIVRVHDVKECRRAIKIADAILRG